MMMLQLLWSNPFRFSRDSNAFVIPWKVCQILASSQVYDPSPAHLPVGSGLALHRLSLFPGCSETNQRSGYRHHAPGGI